MKYEEKLAVVDRYVDGINTCNLDRIRSIFASDAVVEDPVGTDPHIGIDAVMTFYGGLTGFGAVMERTGAVRSAANYAVFPFIVRANGMNIEVIDQFEFNDEGKVQSMRAFWSPENTSMG